VKWGGFSPFLYSDKHFQVVSGKVADKAGPTPAIFTGLLLVAAGVSAFMFFGGIAVLAMLFMASFGLGMFCVSAMVLLNEAVPVSLKGSVSGSSTFYGVSVFSLRLR
jgi:MFS family permease